MPSWARREWLAELTWLVATSIAVGAVIALIHGGGIAFAATGATVIFVTLSAVRVVRLLWRRSANRSVKPS